MWIPRHWARASEGGRTALGWSDANVGEAEAKARERLRRLLELGDGPTPEGWDYYPSRPVQEEILETRKLPGVTLLVTRNRAGALVLNTDRVAFVDVDLPERSSSWLGKLFARKSSGPEPAAAALARIQAWAEEHRARLRAYRTARGLRLLRMDALVDPCDDACQAMFTALGADPQYARLCQAQKSFRARLTPKPARVGCSGAPGSHPRSEKVQESFRDWLESYEEACTGHAVCEFLGEHGTAAALAPAQAVVALHDERTLRPEAELA
jgi:hypothetical protein